MATSTPPKPYIRANTPIISGNERVWADNEFKKLEVTLNSLITYVITLEARIAALEAKG